MPESGYYDDVDPYADAAESGDYLVRVPRSRIRALERKAQGFDAIREERAAAQAAQQEHDDQGVALEPGEANLTRERRDLAAGAPPDQPQSADPYKEALGLYDKVLEDGEQEKVAFGVAFNSVVNAANRGDRRVILRDKDRVYQGPPPPERG